MVSSEKPYLEVTTCVKAISIHFQYAPYKLKNRRMESRRLRVEKLAIDTLAEYFPKLKLSIVNRYTITPLDLEHIYGLTKAISIMGSSCWINFYLCVRYRVGRITGRRSIICIYAEASPRRRGVWGRGGTECSESFEVKVQVTPHAGRRDLLCYLR